MEKDSIREVINELMQQTKTELHNMESNYEASSIALDKLRKRSNLIALSSILIPLFTGVGAILASIIEDKIKIYMLITTAIFNLVLAAARSWLEISSVSGRSAIHASICNVVTESRSKIQKELLSEIQLNILSDASLTSKLKEIENIRNYAIDQSKIIHDLTTSTVTMLIVNSNKLTLDIKQATENLTDRPTS